MAGFRTRRTRLSAIDGDFVDFGIGGWAVSRECSRGLGRNLPCMLRATLHQSA